MCTFACGDQQSEDIFDPSCSISSTRSHRLWAAMMENMIASYWRMMWGKQISLEAWEMIRYFFNSLTGSQLESLYLACSTLACQNLWVKSICNTMQATRQHWHLHNSLLQPLESATIVALPQCLLVLTSEFQNKWLKCFLFILSSTLKILFSIKQYFICLKMYWNLLVL